jgi:hypothetical protein
MSGDLAIGHDGRAILPPEWNRRGDGSWWAVDEYGIEWPVAAFNPLAELDADVQAALGAIGAPVDMTPVSVVDTERE